VRRLLLRGAYGSARERTLLPYLREPGLMLYDVALEVGLSPDGGGKTVISRTRARELYYTGSG
jgi:fumarylacetoacetase